MADKNLRSTKSVAIIGAGAAGAITAAAFAAEKYFDKIRVFERRESAGGTWIYDSSPPETLPLLPGSLPPVSDPPLRIPDNLPSLQSPNNQERFTKTPIYASLTTNVPAIAMSFSDIPFAYGPFAPHHVPKQYVESYFSHHKTDTLLSLNTTVEDLSVVRPGSSSTPQSASEKWKLTLRKHDPVQKVDIWWEEVFDCVVLANGHYSVPFIPEVKGLPQYISTFPGRITHSKTYRHPFPYANKKVLVIGNSASGHDLTAELVSTAHLPVYQSRRSRSRWDGKSPPTGQEWKPVVREFISEGKHAGRIEFEDGTHLDDIDTVIYSTGYKASFPFWNSKQNGRSIYDYQDYKLIDTYLHTFFHDFPRTLGIVGIPRVLTFRSFEYQAIALARVFSGRDGGRLPSPEETRKWEEETEAKKKKAGKKFHEIDWETGETETWLGDLYRIAGLGLLSGEGRTPPRLGEDLKWAIENIKKYPDRRGDEDEEEDGEEEKQDGTWDTGGRFDDVGEGVVGGEANGGEWVVVDRSAPTENKWKRKDLLAFI